MLLKLLVIFVLKKRIVKCGSVQLSKLFIFFSMKKDRKVNAQC